MTRPNPSDQALRLHRSTPVADLHIDILLTNQLLRYDIMKRHRHPLPYSPLIYQADIPRLQDAGIAIAGLGLVTAPLKVVAWLRYKQIRSQLAYLRKTCQENPRALRMIDDAKSMHAAIDIGAIAALPGIEGAHALTGDLDKLNDFYEMGARYLTLAHFSGNEACNCPKGLYNDNPPGLTGFGRKLVDRTQKLGVILDLAHTEKQAFMEAVERAEKPVIVSHTGIRGAFDHWRNIDDEQLEAVAKTGGVVGVMIAPNFLGGAQIRPLSDVTEHILHAVKVVGPDHVAFGTDLDGWIKTMPKGFADATDLPLITDQLLHRGLSEKDVKKILGENVVRAIDANLS